MDYSLRKKVRYGKGGKGEVAYPRYGEGIYELLPDLQCVSAVDSHIGAAAVRKYLCYGVMGAICFSWINCHGRANPFVEPFRPA